MARRYQSSHRLAYFLVGIALITIYLAGQAEAGVMGIDLGGSWFKVAVIQGNRFDLVVNAEGRRKQPVLVGFHRGERVFGRDAERLWARDPSFPVYGYVPQLLGRSSNHSVIVGQKHHYPYVYADDPARNAIYFPDEDGTRFNFGGISHVPGVEGLAGVSTSSLSPEMLVAMILEQAKNTVREDLGADVPDVVITVPPSATQHERLALRNAAGLAGLNVLALINNGAALALNYALGRTKEELAESHHVIFYDMGASQTSVSLAYYSHVPGNAKTSKKNDADLVPQVQIIATAWDETLGGREFDWRLAAYLADVAAEKSGLDIRGNRRAMASLVTEARRTKEVLSANNVATAMVEGLVGDFDFRHDVSRKQFESLCADLIERVAAPLKAVLERSQLQIDDIAFVEIFGGATRVPSVQEAISAAIGGRLPDKHLNSDEAAVMGATFFAASTSSTLRIKTQYRLKDATSFPVDLTFTSGAFEEGFEPVQTLVRADNRLGLKKTVTLRPTDASDIALSLTYADEKSVSEGTPLHFADYSISGLPSKEADKFIDEPKVFLAFRLDKSGLLSLDQAVAHYSVEELVPVEPKNDTKKLKTTTAKPADDGDADAEPKADAEAEAEPEVEAEAETVDAGEADVEVEVQAEEAAPEATEGEEAEELKEAGEEEPAQPEEVEMILTVKEKSKNLEVGLTSQGIVPLSAAQIRRGKTLLLQIQRVEKLKLDTEEARSTLEAFVYEAREKVEDDSAFIAHLSEEERASLSASVTDASEWMYGDGETAELPALQAKLAELHVVYDKATNRINVRETFPLAWEKLNTTLPTILTRIYELIASRNVSETEQEEFRSELAIRYASLKNRSAEQLELPLDQDPIVTEEDCTKLTTWLTTQERRFKYKPLKTKPIKPKTKVPVNTTNTTEAAPEATTPEAKPETVPEQTTTPEATDATAEAEAATEEQQEDIHEL